MATTNVLIVSSDATFASILERELGADFHCHSAASDAAAFALLDAYSYDCVVVDLSARSTAGQAIASSLRPSALTLPIVALVSSDDLGSELPPQAIVITIEDDAIAAVAAAVRTIR